MLVGVVVSLARRVLVRLTGPRRYSLRASSAVSYGFTRGDIFYIFYIF
jgi:hypothetical protein